MNRDLEFPDPFATFTVFCPRCKVALSRVAPRGKMQELCDGPYVCGFCPTMIDKRGDRYCLHFEAVSNLSSCIALLQRQLVYGHEIDINGPIPPPNASPFWRAGPP